MAKHKAATEITIIQEERSAFAELVDRYKWHGLGVLLVLGAVIFWRASSSTKAVEADRAAWVPLHESLSKQGASIEDTIAALGKTAGSGDPVVKSVANIIQAGLLAEEDDFNGAAEALTFATENAPALLKTLEVPAGPDGENMSILASLSAAVEREAEWKNEFHEKVYTNVLPEKAPRYKIETSAGDIIVGLHSDEASGHAKNFTLQANEGAFNGTLLHGPAIDMSGNPIPGIRGGDPNTRDNEDVTTWGQGGIESGLSGEGEGLTHEKGALAAIVVQGQRTSSKTQFMILTEPYHENDRRYTVFGKVVEGLDVVERLAEAPLREGEGSIYEEPASIISVTKIE